MCTSAASLNGETEENRQLGHSGVSLLLEDAEEHISVLLSSVAGSGSVLEEDELGKVRKESTPDRG